MKYAIVIFILLTVGCKYVPSLSKHFEDKPGCFILYDVKNDEYIKYDEEKCKERYSPCSTFKIPHTIIALETGALADADEIIKWDSLKYPRQQFWPDEWAKDHNLKSAFKYSVVWFYKELSERINPDTYKKYLDQFNYGNKDLSGPKNEFWLVSSLKISPDEQMNFIKNLFTGKLNITSKTYKELLNMMILEETGFYTLYGKTGMGDLESGKFISWVVGMVENDKGVYLYVFDYFDTDSKRIINERIERLKGILSDLEVLP